MRTKIALFAACWALVEWRATAAPLALTNGLLYTGNAAQPRATAVLVTDGRIRSVGTDAAILRAMPAGTRVINLRGQTVVPGLVDAHVHLAGIGAREVSFNLEGTRSLGELEHERGTIEVGKLADFTVLSADIMEIPEPEILRTRCVMTVIGGEVVWEEK